MVVVDSDVLSLLLNPAIDPPIDPNTGKPTEKVSERLELLVAELEKARERVVVPAPALAELMVIADESGPDYLTEIDKQAAFSVEPFDARAAIEAGAKTRAAKERGDKKSGAKGYWQCVKTDRQIVAIAKTLGATRIYSNDSDMVNIAADSSIDVIAVWQLPYPASTTPLLDTIDAEPTTPSLGSSETPPPSVQSPDVEPVSGVATEQDRLSSRHDGRGPQQPDSSLPASPPPRSEK